MIRKLSVLALVWAILPSLTYADPSVTEVSGTVEDGEMITISGSNFGSGPSLGVYELFNEVGKTDGDTVSLSGPLVGSWSGSEYEGHIRYEDAESVSGLYSGRVVGGNDTYSSTYAAPENYTEIYLSYWVKVPNGECFPGTPNTQELPGLSSWKFTWLTLHDNTGDDDLVTPTWAPGWMINGNGEGYVDYVSFHWQWDTWQRYSFYIKAGPNPVSDNGILNYQELAGGNQYNVSDTSQPIFSDLTTPYWNHIRFTGWAVSTSECNGGIMDDIYVATGDNAQARVEIGNASTYTASTNLTLLAPSSWSTNSITATVNQGSFADSSLAYLYVVDKDGNVNSTGYEITIGEGSSSTIRLLSPMVQLLLL